jgi:hypothetical protein
MSFPSSSFVPSGAAPARFSDACELRVVQDVLIRDEDNFAFLFDNLSLRVLQAGPTKNFPRGRRLAQRRSAVLQESVEYDLSPMSHRSQENCPEVKGVTPRASVTCYI